MGTAASIEAMNMRKDAIDHFAESVERALSDFRKAMAECPDPCGSRALAFAIQAGLPPQMSYTVDETARYTGICKKTLYDERDAGRLSIVLPNGAARGSRILVTEVDRWFEATNG